MGRKTDNHIIFFISLNSYSQSLKDTIITNDSDTIICQVTYVNEYSVFYKVKKKKKLKDRIIPRIDIADLIINNKNINIPEKKFDSGINEYYRKSKLNRKYEVLLLKENTEKSLKLLGDSIFSINSTDFFYTATKIQSFANQYKCKLIYVSDLNSNSIHIKLYDASDEYYHKVLKSYQKSKIYFLRANNKLEFKEFEFKINNTTIKLNKNEYYILDLTKIDSSFSLKQGALKSNRIFEKDSLYYNEYYYMGTPNYYSDFTARNFGIFAGVMLGGVLGGGVAIVITSGNKTRINNFIGEFIKINIDKINNNESTTIYKRNAQ